MTKLEKVLLMIVVILAIFAIMAAILMIVGWNTPHNGKVTIRAAHSVNPEKTFSTFYPATDPEPDLDLYPELWQEWHDRNF